MSGAQSLADYFAMGGYAVFIWPSYALGVVLVIGIYVLAARRLAAAEHALDAKDAGGQQGGAEEETDSKS